MKKYSSQPTFFDAIEIEEDREQPDCPHRHRDPTLTIWAGETFERLTWTCRACGFICGRA